MTTREKGPRQMIAPEPHTTTAPASAAPRPFWWEGHR